MARLFTTLWPSDAAVTALRAELAAVSNWPPEGWRAVPMSRWHVTLCFHGEGDAGVLARRLDAAAGGLPAPTLRLAGAVALDGVAAVGVRPVADADGDALHDLVRAAGGAADRFRAHLTLARTTRRGDAPPPRGPLDGYAGPHWRPAEVCLVRSELTSGVRRYTVLHRVNLAHGEVCPVPGGDRAHSHTW